MTIPREQGLDHTITLMSEGYTYIPDRRRQFQSDIFQTRLMGQKVICMGGEEAARIFYDPAKFTRKGALPKRIQQSIFGKNGVQMQDGAQHKHRKEMFMKLMAPERINDLAAIAKEQWEVALAGWEKRHRLVLMPETEEIMCRIACQWAGVPLWANELTRRTRDLAAMIDAFGAVGPRHWKGRMARNRTERWIMQLIEQVRNGTLTPRAETALSHISWHRDLQGHLLPVHTAAVDVINILRPIVAVARYVTYGALAMHAFPEAKQKLQNDAGAYTGMFVQEVRRYYPFTPFLGARVRHDFNWDGHSFKKGTLVLLDVYGTNHDPNLWDEPEEFQPERFRNWDGGLFDFIPQGGGRYNSNHRCAGESITLAIIRTSLECLANRLDYEVPQQDMTYSMVRMPSVPKSRFVIKNIATL
ncbi:cytochrome P450 [Barrientosiimonas marina]|uniref:Cytochrome P450 n=1 Tax=Lentibacillus kimchii TaxID=1542911 RepID=A0ABW2UU19_9BACI